MNTRRRILLMLLALAIAFAVAMEWRARRMAPEGGDTSASASVGAPPLTGAAIGGPFALVDQDGKPRTDKDFAGKYRLIYFGYTFCPDVCPNDVQKMMQAYRAFETKDAGRAAKVQPIFVTIDPARDTPAAVKEFVTAFHPKLVGLTGTQQQVDPVLKTFRVFAAKRGTGANYLMDHSAMIFLFGPDGAPISFVSQDGDAAAVEAELQKWVR